MRRLLVLGAVGACLVGSMFVARAATAPPPPHPEPNFAKTLVPSPCAAEKGDQYEAAIFAREGWAGPDYVRYPGACQRLKFAFGPLTVKPGQNDVLVEPITVEKPAYDGYITRMTANLVTVDGQVPPIEQMHLHHGTWLSLTNAYG